MQKLHHRSQTWKRTRPRIYSCTSSRLPSRALTTVRPSCWPSPAAEATQLSPAARSTCHHEHTSLPTGPGRGSSTARSAHSRTPVTDFLSGRGRSRWWAGLLVPCAASREHLAPPHPHITPCSYLTDGHTHTQPSSYANICSKTPECVWFLIGRCGLIMIIHYLGCAARCVCVCVSEILQPNSERDRVCGGI